MKTPLVLLELSTLAPGSTALIACEPRMVRLASSLAEPPKKTLREPSFQISYEVIRPRYRSATAMAKSVKNDICAGGDDAPGP